jgi:hypothetical protein
MHEDGQSIAMGASYSRDDSCGVNHGGDDAPHVPNNGELDLLRIEASNVLLIVGNHNEPAMTVRCCGCRVLLLCPVREPDGHWQMLTVNSAILRFLNRPA